MYILIIREKYLINYQCNNGYFHMSSTIQDVREVMKVGKYKLYYHIKVISDTEIHINALLIDTLTSL